MPESDEIVALLREIRDLQKAHEEQYRLFTSSAMARQEKTAVALEQSRLTAKFEREKQQTIQERLLQSAKQGRVVIIVSAVIQGLFTGLLALLALWALLRRL